MTKVQKTYFNYAHLRYYEAQKKSLQSAAGVGNFDRVYGLGINEIDEDFYQQNRVILSTPNGAGLWVWKYYLMVKLLSDKCVIAQTIPEGSWIFYGDADMEFIGPVDFLIDCLARDPDNSSVMVFRSPAPYIQDLQCKADAFILTDTDTPEIRNSTTRGGGLFLCRKDDIAREFFQETLRYACDRRIIDARIPNQMGRANPPEFIRHADDEALTSIMAKKHRLYPYRWPATDSLEESTNRVRVTTLGGTNNQPARWFTLYEYPALTPGRSAYPKLMVGGH